MFHSRCLALDTILRSQISDLRDEITELKGHVEAARQAEKEAQDKLLLLSNPQAMRLLAFKQRASEDASAVRPGSPAAPRPAVRRDTEGRATFHDPTPFRRPVGDQRLEPPHPDLSRIDPQPATPEEISAADLASVANTPLH